MTEKIYVIQEYEWDTIEIFDKDGNCVYSLDHRDINGYIQDLINILSGKYVVKSNKINCAMKEEK